MRTGLFGMNVRKKVFPRNQNLKMNLMLNLLFQHSNVFSHDLLTKIIGLLNEVPFQRLVYRENLALINILSHLGNSGGFHIHLLVFPFV